MQAILNVSYLNMSFFKFKLFGTKLAAQLKPGPSIKVNRCKLESIDLDNQLIIVVWLVVYARNMLNSYINIEQIVK